MGRQKQRTAWGGKSGAQHGSASVARSSGRAAGGGKSGAKRNAMMWGWGGIKRREMGCKELPRCLDKSGAQRETAKAARSNGRAAGSARAARSMGDSKSNPKDEAARATRNSGEKLEEGEKQARGIIFLEF